MEQYVLPEGIFSCRRQKNGCFHIIDYDGDAKILFIPEHIEGVPVISIEKKAFWRNRNLQHVILPDTIEQIGEWAFSDCAALRKVTIPRREIIFGNHVFLKTARLREISFAGSEPSVDRLMAAAATALKAEYLLDPLQAGSDSWYHNLDARILTVINETQDSALKDLVYCAEEDMGAKQDACLKEQAYKKAEIVFLRLAYPDKITDDTYETLADYLRQRTAGCEEQTAWEVVKKNTQDQSPYCDILIKIGGIREDNFQETLETLGEEAIELKACLLKKWQSRQQNIDSWELLEL